MTFPDHFAAFPTEIAAAAGSAPVVARLESPSRSKDSLSDTGAGARLQGRALTRLQGLDPRRHFLSGAVADRVRAAVGSAGTEVDQSEQRAPHRRRDEEWRCVAVSE